MFALVCMFLTLFGCSISANDGDVGWSVFFFGVFVFQCAIFSAELVVNELKERSRVNS